MPRRRVRLSILFLLMVMVASALAPVLEVAAADDFASLRAEIEAANGGGSGSIRLTGEISLDAALPQIRGNLSIDGGGHTISGADSFRIFDVNGGTLTLKHVTLTEGNSGAAYGGAIRLLNGARVTIDSSTITNSSAPHGGAIASAGGSTLSISNSSLSGNRADDSAGAIYAAGGTVSISDSSFVKNCALRYKVLLNIQHRDRESQSVDDDGCIYITYYRSRLEDEIPLVASGGAIRLLNGARGVVERSTFNENKARDGGAIATSGGGVRLTIDRSSFISNEASSVGGAIYAERAITTITSSSFVKNAARTAGGAVAVSNDRLEISNSTFSENQSESGPGALEIDQDAGVVVSHATFMSNWSLHRDASTILKWDGGRLFLRNSIVVSGGRSEDCVGGFTQNIGNISPDGTCAIKASEDPLLGDLSGWPAYHPLLDHSPAIDAADAAYCPETDQRGVARPAGGSCDSGAVESTNAEAAPAPVVPPPACSLADQIIAANTDRAVEGCPAGSGADTIVFERNVLLFAPQPAITSTITIEGAGYTISGDKRFRIFDVDRGRLTVNNLTLREGRTSSGRGGAIRLQNGGRATVNDSRLIENVADIGGAIAVDANSPSPQQLTVNSSSFIKNRASRTGGAIDFNFGGATITTSSFIDNSAGQSGGAIDMLNYSQVEVSNSSFINNRSAWGGGALAAENGANATLTHVTIYSNESRGARTAIHIFFTGFGARSRVSLRNSIISGSPRRQDCFGDLAQNVGNIIRGGSCEPMLSDDPMLEEPAETATFVSPLPGSPAIGAAERQFCPETDQIGRPRAIVGRCDIGAIEAIPVQRTLSNCAVTTVHVLNFRDAPNGRQIGQVQHDQTFTPLARTPGWFQVEDEVSPAGSARIMWRLRGIAARYPQRPSPNLTCHGSGKPTACQRLSLILLSASASALIVIKKR